MTSKISFSKLVRDEYKKLTWLTALMSLVFGLLIPFRVMMVMALSSSDYKVEWVGSAARMEELTKVFWSQIGFGHFENTFFILCAGSFCALCAFSYLHSAVKLDFYHSLPLKRETLFAVRGLSSILTFIVPYVICQLLGLLAGIPYGVDVASGAAEQMAATGQGILFYLAGYTGALLALMLTGKMLTTIFAVGVFGCYIPALWLLMLVLVELFLNTSMMEETVLTNFSNVLQYSSPWALSACQGININRETPKGLTGYWPDSSGISVLLLMIIALFLISLLLYRRRRTERAGSALAFRHTEMPVKLALVIPSAVAAGVMGYAIFQSVIWAFVFIVLFGALFCMIMEFIYRWDIRLVLAHKGQMVLAILAAVLIFCGFRYDLAGYNSYLPKQEEIEAMAVLDGNTNYGYNVDGRWLTDNREILDYLETDQVEPLYRIAECGVELERAADAFTEFEYSGNYWFVYVKYHLKSGKEIYRQYQVNADVLIECMDQVLADESYHERYFSFLTVDEKLLQTAYLDVYTMESQVDWDESEQILPEDKEESETGDIPPESETAYEEEDPQESIAEEENWMDGMEYAEEYTEDPNAVYFEGEDLKKLLEAYKEDMKDITLEDSLYKNGGLQIWTKPEKDGNAVWLEYPINEKCIRTRKVFMEKWQESKYGQEEEATEI